MHIQKRSKLNLLFSALFCAVAILVSGSVSHAYTPVTHEDDYTDNVYVTQVCSYTVHSYTAETGEEVANYPNTTTVLPFTIKEYQGHLNFFTLKKDNYLRTNSGKHPIDVYSHSLILYVVSDAPFKIGVDGSSSAIYDSANGFYYSKLTSRGVGSAADNGSFEVDFPNCVTYSGETGDSSASNQEQRAFIATLVNFNKDITGDDDDSARWDYDHNFGADVYDSSIPVPQLSSLNILGAFHVDNADPSRDLDLYVETNFYGVLHDDDNKDFKLNKDYLVGHHRYNFTSPDVSYSDADWSIAEKYGVEIGDAMMEDFQRWTELFPTHKDLPDYNWLKHNSADYTTAYNAHIYRDSAPAFALRLSKQCEVTYYVRFCQYSGGTYKYGQWKAYTVSPDGQTTSKVSIGDVSSDSNGNPVVTNPVSGNQNGDGEFEIELPTNVNLDTSNIFQTVIDIIKQFPELVSAYIAFSQFLVATFAFIPVQIWGAIATCFNLSVVILLYKYVRGM